MKKILSFLGPGFLVTVGFIDPGNWATNIEGGSSSHDPGEMIEIPEGRVFFLPPVP